MKRREAKFGMLFRHWLKANPIPWSASFELKETTTDSIPFSDVKGEQINYGLAIQSDKGVLIRTEGVEGLPDYVYMMSSPAYVVIKYPKAFFVILLDKFMKEKEQSQRKSLTLERAEAISQFGVKL